MILIEELEKIRRQQGFISEEEMIRLAETMEVSKAELYGIVSFYSRFYTQKQGEYIIRICKSIVCGMNGSNEISLAIQDYLGVIPGETTGDGLFTLEMMECLGQCDVSPAMTINDEVYGNLTPESAVEILKSYRTEREV